MISFPCAAPRWHGASQNDGQLAGRQDATLGDHELPPEFITADYLKSHPENDWMRGLLSDMKLQPWTHFSVNMKPQTEGEPRKLPSAEKINRLASVVLCHN